VTALALQSVSAGYRGREVVHSVSAVVRPGGWLGVIGPNGAGKSTLVKAIAALVPHRGRVLLDGRDVGDLDRRRLARVVGYAPQNPVLPDGLTVTDYALLGRTPHLPLLGREGATDLDLVADVLARLDLRELADRPLATLSGGERQRAVLARALAQQAAVLLLDEPTAGLDIGHAQDLLELVDHLRTAGGMTVVSTLHDLTLAGQFADELLLLDGGRVVASGRPQHVLTAEVIEQHYRAGVTVLDVGGAGRAVVPIRRPGPDQAQPR
jgi:iron complex transport system ATP-binding protein